MAALVPITDLRLTPSDGEIPRAQVARAGTSWSIAGVVLEGAWSYGSEVLVATTDDIPYEDGLNFSLLSQDGHVIEEVQLSGIYTTGSFELLGVDGAALRFRFFGDTDWALRVCDSPQFRVPLLGDPRGVKRPLGFAKRLIVTGRPKPDQ